jgi:thioredoxin 1
MLLPVMFVGIGGLIGAALGYFGQCSSGTCPLTSTWWRGALYGSVMGLVLYTLSGRGSGAAEDSKNVLPIKESNFDAEVIQASTPVVVDFFATWCAPCRKLSPMLDKLAEPFAGQIKFVKVNIDEAPGLAKQYKIEGVPTLLFFKGGKTSDAIVGLPSAEELKSRLQALAQPAKVTES